MWQAVIECNPSNDLLNKYNGTEYNFDSIDIVSAGERDPERDGAPNVPKMRDFAARGDMNNFVSNVLVVIQILLPECTWIYAKQWAMRPTTEIPSWSPSINTYGFRHT